MLISTWDFSTWSTTPTQTILKKICMYSESYLTSTLTWLIYFQFSCLRIVIWPPLGHKHSFPRLQIVSLVSVRQDLQWDSIETHLIVYSNWYLTSTLSEFFFFKVLYLQNLKNILNYVLMEWILFTGFLLVSILNFLRYRNLCGFHSNYHSLYL